MHGSFGEESNDNQTTCSTTVYDIEQQCSTKINSLQQNSPPVTKRSVKWPTPQSIVIGRRRRRRHSIKSFFQQCSNNDGTGSEKVRPSMLTRATQSFNTAHSFLVLMHYLQQVRCQSRRTNFELQLRLGDNHMYSLTLVVL
jgi:hypothetical protein